MPFDFDSSGIAANVSIGYGANSPQIKFTAPNKSCLWNDFPVQIKVPRLVCASPSDPQGTIQINPYSVTFGAGPFTPPDSDFPFMHVYDAYDAILCGYKLEVKLTGTITFGSAQIGVANPCNGCSACSDPTYYNGAFDSGWVDAGACTCAQAATFPDGHEYFTPVFRPFSPLVGFGLINGTLNGRWVSSGTSIPDYQPNVAFGVFFAAPGTDSVRQLPLGDDSGASPPSSDWANSIVVGDAGMEDASGSPHHGVKAVGGGHGTMWWQTNTYAGQQSIMAFAVPGPSGADAMYLFLRVRDPGTAGVDGYMLKGMDTSCETYRIDNGVATLLDTFTLDYPMAAAFGYRFWATGNLLGVQANIEKPDFFGSELPFIGSSSDATYAGDDSYVGVGLDGATAEIVVVMAGDGNTTPNIEGLTIVPATSGCGIITTTFTNVKSAIDAMNVAGTCPITATLLGGHGSDLVGPTAGALTGAHCTGGTYWREGMETP